MRWTDETERHLTERNEARWAYEKSKRAPKPHGALHEVGLALLVLLAFSLLGVLAAVVW